MKELSTEEMVSLQGGKKVVVKINNLIIDSTIKQSNKSVVYAYDSTVNVYQVNSIG